MSTRIIDAMRRIEILRGLSDQELLRVADLCKAMRVPPGTTIFREGDEGNEMYLIHEGSVRIVINTHRADGTVSPSTINILHASQCFGELIVLNSGFRSATVIAMEPTILIVLGGVQFRKLCVTYPHIGYCVIYNLAQDLANNLRSATLLLHGNVRLESAVNNEDSDTVMVDGYEQMLASKDTEIKLLNGLTDSLHTQKRTLESDLRQQERQMVAKDIEIRQLSERLQAIGYQKRDAEAQVRQYQQSIAAMEAESRQLNALTQDLDKERYEIDTQLRQLEQQIATKDIEVRQLTEQVERLDREKQSMEQQIQQQQDDCDYLNAVVAGYRERERQRRKPPWAE